MNKVIIAFIYIHRNSSDDVMRIAQVTYKQCKVTHLICYNIILFDFHRNQFEANPFHFNVNVRNYRDNCYSSWTLFYQDDFWMIVYFVGHKISAVLIHSAYVRQKSSLKSNENISTKKLSSSATFIFSAG